jgi:hypothetical protein
MCFMGGVPLFGSIEGDDWNIRQLCPAYIWVCPPSTVSSIPLTNKASFEAR